MATKSGTSPLLDKLSPELRNMIYELALEESESVNIFAPKQRGLPETCRIIRHECLGLYYAGISFSGTIYEDPSTGLLRVQRWLERIGKTNCQHLRKLTVVVSIPEALPTLKVGGEEEDSSVDP